MDGRLPIRLAAIVFALGIASPAFANDCDRLLDAIKAIHKLTYRTVASRVTADGKATEIGQVIQAPDARYVEVRGAWHKMPPDTGEMMKEAEQDVAAGRMTCTEAGSETLKGKRATVYAIHTEKEDVKSDSKVWLDADRHFLRSETKAKETTFLAEYDYDNIEIPKDAAPMTLPGHPPAKH